MPWKSAAVALVVAVLCTGGLASAAAADEIVTSSRDNGAIAFGRLDPTTDIVSLWVAKPNGNGQKRITEGPAGFSDWSPDGSRIAFDYPDESGVHIATIAPDGTDRRALTTAEGIQEAPDWSPDGTWITYNAFTFDADPFAISIWVMRSDGSKPRMITDGAIDVEPVFSPDGRRIAFGRIVGDSPEGQLEAIYVVNTDGTGLREVVPPRAGLEHPDWSPDGRSIVFNIAPEPPAAAPDAGSILSVRPNGQDLHVLVPATATLGFFKPAWSPDGRRLLAGCHDTAADLDRLCIIAGNGKARVVVGGDTPVNVPSWGPRPKHTR